MTTTALTRTFLATLAAGCALTLAGACGGLGGDGSGRPFQHATKFVVSGSHQGFTCDKCHESGGALLRARGRRRELPRLPPGRQRDAESRQRRRVRLG